MMRDSNQQRRWSFKKNRIASFFSGSDDSIYFHEQLLEKVFWKLYTKTDDADDVRKENNNQDRTILAALFDAIVRKLPKHAWKSIMLYYNLFFALTKQNSTLFDDKLFRKYLLNERKKIGYTVIMLALIVQFIVFLTNVVRARNNWGNTELFNFDLYLIIYGLIWSCLTFSCLLFFICFKYIPKKSLEFLQIDLFDYWDYIGKTIITTKTFLIAYNITNGYFLDRKCYSSWVMANDNKTLAYVAFTMVWDMVEISVFASLPFYWKWILLYSSLSYLEMILRIYTCADLTIYISNKKQLEHCLMLSISLYFLVMVFFLAFNNQIRFFTSFTIMQEQRKVAGQKMKLINLLCRDVKLAALKHQRIFRSFRQTIITAKEHQRLQSQSNTTNSEEWKEEAGVQKIKDHLVFAEDHATPINDSVNDLVFLVKLGERRFTFSYSDVFHIANTIKSLIAVESMIRDKDKFRFKDYFLNIENLPQYMIRSHLNCFRILFCFSINILYGMWEERYGADKVGCQPLKEEEKVVVICKKQRLRVGERNHLEFTFFHILFKFVDKERFSYPLTINNSRDENMKSWCIACQSIVNSYHGVFDVTATSVEFTIPAERVNEFLGENVAEDELTDTESENEKEKLNESNQRKEKQHDSESIGFLNFLQKESCVFLSDPTMESLVMDAMLMLCGNQNSIDIYKNQESLTTILTYSVIFIQSTEAFAVLKNGGYKGSTVLLSEHLSYLGDLKELGIDHGVLLPANKEEILKLKKWLHGTIRRDSLHSKVDEPVHVRSSFLQKSKNEEEAFQAFMKSHSEEQKNSSSFLGGFFSTPKEIKVQFNSFVKWNHLTVYDKGLSCTMHMDVIFPLLLAWQTISWRLGAVTKSGFRALFAITLCGWFRGWINDCLLVPFGIPFNYYYRTWWGFILLVCVFGLITDSVDIQLQPFHIGYHRVTFPSYYEFLTADGHRGLEISFTMVNFMAFGRYLCELMPWPFSWMIFNIYTARAMICFLIYYPQFLPIQNVILGSFYMFVVNLLFLFFLKTGSTELNKEFLSIYYSVISDDFFDRCLLFTKDIVIRRLEKVNKLESTLIDLLKEVLKQKKMNLTKLQYSLLIHLQGNYLKIQRIHFILQTNEKHFFHSTRENFLIHMKATLLFPFLSKICSLLLYENNYFYGLLDPNQLLLNRLNSNTDPGPLLSSSVNGDRRDATDSTLFPIKIFIKIHPNISLIRINQDLLLTTMIDLCQLSIRNIQKSIQDNSKNNFINHQILLILKPAPTKEILRYNQLRELDIIVLDTSYLGEGKTQYEKAYSLANCSIEDSSTSLSSETFLKSKGFSFSSTSNDEELKEIFLAKRRENDIQEMLKGMRDNERNFLLKQKDLIAKESEGQFVNAPRLQIMKTEFHSLSDRFSAYFQFSSQSEYGFLLNHFQYHAYYKVSLPYMLCTSSYDLELAMQKERAQIRQIFPPSMKYLIQYHILYNQRKLREKEALKAATTSNNVSNNASNSQAASSKPLGYQQPSTFVPMPRHGYSSVNVSTEPQVESKKKGFIGSVSLYYRSNSDTFYASKEIMKIFQQKDWDCKRQSYSSFMSSSTTINYPDKSKLIESDIIILEYAPDQQFNVLGREGDGGSIDLRNFIHYIRAVGCQALIVIVYASYVNEQDDHVAYCLNHPNEYSDAMSADKHLPLPWRLPHIDEILIAWEEKFFKVMINKEESKKPLPN